MVLFDVLSFVPENIKRKVMDSAIDYVSEQANNLLGSNAAGKIKKLRSDSKFQEKFNYALQRASNRFIEQFEEDERLRISKIVESENFFGSQEIQKGLVDILQRPSLYMNLEEEEITDHFSRLLVNRQNKDDAIQIVSKFLKCLLEEVWYLEEFRGIYSLLFQKMTAEGVKEQVQLQKAQLEATVNVNKELSDTLLQLTYAIADKKLLESNDKLQIEERSGYKKNLGIEADRSTLFETYKNNLISEINNNLVLELYDKLHYEDICITPFVSPTDASDNRNKIIEINNLTKSSRTAIVGEPGSGKTTALRKVALDLLYQTPCELVPIYVSLATFAMDFNQGKFEDLSGYLDYEVSLFGCPNIQTLKIGSNAEVLLLLDGWDEIIEEKARVVLKKFLSTTDHKFIITSRPEAQRSLPFADRFEMHPLSFERIQEFVKLRIRNPELVKKIIRWLLSDPSMLKLAEIPLNLSIMTIVFSEEGDVGRLTKTKLYERAFETIVRQHHREHPYEGVFSSDEDQTLQIEQIMQIIAYDTMISGGGRFFSIRQLNKAAIEVLNKVPPGLSTLLSGKLGIIRDRRSGRMEFFHLWYQEFLTARQVVESGNNILDQLENKNLASILPYTIGLIPDQRQAFSLMKEVAIHDPFNFCRAITEGLFNLIEIEELLVRIISYGESSKPKIPVRVELARALAQAGLHAVPSLFQIVRNEQLNDYARRAALEALAILPVKQAEFEELLQELLETKSLGLLWHVIEHVGKKRVNLSIKRLQEYTEHEDPIVVGDAIWALAEINQTKTIDLPSDEVDALLACLSSDDRHVQGHALRTLGRLRIESAVPKLIKHITNYDSGYRWIAPEAAALIGGNAAIELLEIALNDHDYRVIAAAIKALIEIDQEIPERILDKVKSHTFDTTWIAFLEQPLGAIARSTYQKLLNRESKISLAEIYVARHCKTTWNLEKRLQGTNDLPLSPEGRIQAETNIEKIAELGIDRIISSSSKRAYETAQIYAEHLKVPLHKHPGLRELDHGNWEGKRIDELVNDPQYRYNDWLKNPTLIDIPDSSESITSAQQRIVEAVTNIALRYKGEKLLIITHKHIKAILMCALRKIGLEHFQNQIEETIAPQKIPSQQIDDCVRLFS